MSGADHFSPDYATARARFRRAAEVAGCALEAHPIGQRGAQGEELTIDVALCGAELPTRTVVVSSGLHGVEGFLGSAVQLAVLEDLPARGLPEGLRLVFVHALNPYGFSWIRRVNEHNVDLNRNFLRPGESYSGSPAGYAELDGMLNPRRASRPLSLFLPRAALSIARHGMAALKNAVAGGQYDFPQGLFFGGHAPERTNELVAEHIGRWVGEATTERTYHVDFHSGLGAPATYKLLVDHPTGDPVVADLERDFGADVVQPWDPTTGVAYEIKGGLGTWCQARFGPRYDVLVAEFGTLPPIGVVRALHLENRAHHWGRPGDRATRRAKEAMMAAFAPRGREWRDVTAQRGVAIVERALRALSPVEAGAERAEVRAAGRERA
ncbi:MAG: M14 family metallopeptidase [Planctomycetota bacterium]